MSCTKLRMQQGCPPAEKCQGGATRFVGTCMWRGESLYKNLFIQKKGSNKATLFSFVLLPTRLGLVQLSIFSVLVASSEVFHFENTEMQTAKREENDGWSTRLIDHTHTASISLWHHAQGGKELWYCCVSDCKMYKHLEIWQINIISQLLDSSVTEKTMHSENPKGHQAWLKVKLHIWWPISFHYTTANVSIQPHPSYNYCLIGLHNMIRKAYIC